MASSSELGPRRQDSNVSSTSSGNRTLRASSNGGRRRSSTSTAATATGGFFARLKGKTRKEDDGDSDGVSPSFAYEEMEPGPSDYWRRTPSPPVPAPGEACEEEVPGSSPPGSLDAPERKDDWEYERRMQGVLDAPVDVNGVSNGYFDIPPRALADTDIVLGDGTSLPREGVGDVASDELSERTPSMASFEIMKASSTPTKAYPNPQISRLRSHLRTFSSTTQATKRSSRPVAHSRTPSQFSQILTTANTSLASAFSVHPLHQLSRLFSDAPTTMPPKAKSTLDKGVVERSLGKPMVMDVNGMIAVGTDNGHVVVCTFAQEIRATLGHEGLGPVTTVTISPDRTYIGVGHATGNIYLYDLSNPSKPARTTLALNLRQVLSGRKEGHLQRSRILHIGFVGSRHTSIVTGDEHGRAFWWSLGKVIGVESNDVVRMLGSYPEQETAPPHPPKRSTTLFAAVPLPLGTAHPTDTFHLTALLTPTKLVIVGMRPQAKTWFRKIREGIGGDAGATTGCAQWLRTGELDPVLAYSWGTAVRFLRVQVTEGVTPVEGRQFDAPDPVRALQWFDENHVLLITFASMILLDLRSMTPVETASLQSDLLPDGACGSRVRTYRGKLFLLVGSLLHWNDRILARVHQGDFLGAIQVAMAYYQDQLSGNRIGLPEDPSERREIIGTRIRELMTASLHWAFSEDRMRDDTHYSLHGRGVDLTSLYEGLASSCIQACVSLNDLKFLFDETYEYFATAGIQGIFFDLLEPYIFDGQISQTPPHIVQALINTHDVRGEYDRAEAIIWHVEPETLDINQAVRLCEAHALWDALFHVYARAMKDYVAPLVQLIRIVQDVAPTAYKIFPYIEMILSGESYPTGEPLPVIEGKEARSQVYGFLFSPEPVSWNGETILPEVTSPYPYLHLLLQFDTEAFLHAMDIAFEDPYLNESPVLSRQSIVDLLLNTMNPEDFPPNITFLHIFVARNLPKYTQFLLIPPPTLHQILISLAEDPDQSTREDRQLAAEYLLSVYTPHDIEDMLENSGFFRILRESHRRKYQWSPLISTYFKDPDANEEIFAALDEIIRETTPEAVSQVVTQGLPHLFDLSVPQTALLLDKDLPSLHDSAIELLSKSEHKQMAYLRCLLEPSDQDEENGPLPPLRVSSHHLSTSARHRYVSLLCSHDADHLIAFLDAQGPTFFDLTRLAEDCEKDCPDGQLWAIDRQGKTKETFDVVGEMLRSRGGSLREAMIHHETGPIHMALQSIRSVSRMAVRLCQEHSEDQTDQVEQMWLGLLHDMVELVHSVSALWAPGGEDPDGVVDSIRSLVGETLQTLVSSSSKSLAFPRLFKRLVEASTSSTVAKKGRAYSEFRSILTGMLESYRAEGDMLRMTTRLVGADLFVAVQEVTERRQRGWRPLADSCEACGRVILQANGTKTIDTFTILGSGMVLHQVCKDEQEA